MTRWSWYNIYTYILVSFQLIGNLTSQPWLFLVIWIWIWWGNLILMRWYLKKSYSRHCFLLFVEKITCCPKTIPLKSRRRIRLCRGWGSLPLQKLSGRALRLQRRGDRDLARMPSSLFRNGFTWHKPNKYYNPKACSLFSSYVEKSSGYSWTETCVSGLKECWNAAGK